MVILILIALSMMLETSRGFQASILQKECYPSKTYIDQDRWRWSGGYSNIGKSKARVVAIDFGVKENILRCLTANKCEVIVLPATATAEEVLLTIQMVYFYLTALGIRKRQVSILQYD